MPTPRPTGRISHSSLRVRYAETDAMGIVHHSRYIPWFEVGRSDWLREGGLPYGELQAMGYYLTVVEIGARYLRPAHYDEIVTVRTWLAQLQSRSIHLAYEIVNAAGAVLVTGFSRHICITHDGAPVHLPPRLVALFTEQAEGAAQPMTPGV